MQEGILSAQLLRRHRPSEVNLSCFTIGSGFGVGSGSGSGSGSGVGSAGVGFGAGSVLSELLGVGVVPGSSGSPPQERQASIRTAAIPRHRAARSNFMRTLFAFCKCDELPMLYRTMLVTSSAVSIAKKDEQKRIHKNIGEIAIILVILSILRTEERGDGERIGVEKRALL